MLKYALVAIVIFDSLVLLSLENKIEEICSERTAIDRVR